MQSGLVAQGVPVAAATQAAHLPPVGSLFAAFLGYNPMKTLIPAKTLASLPAANAATITGKRFFPTLISHPFMHGLRLAFALSVVLFLIAAAASWLRGKHVVGEEEPALATDEQDLWLEEAVVY
jgi:hypothetical protein